METKTEKVSSYGMKITLNDNGKEIGRGYLYVMNNDLHDQPFGLIEDVFVDKEYRGQELGKKLVELMIKEARENKCYKIIFTSRYGRDSLHKWYDQFGFEDWGKEFRMNL